MLVKSFSVVFAMIAAFLVSIGANTTAKSEKIKTSFLIALSGFIDLAVDFILPEPVSVLGFVVILLITHKVIFKAKLTTSVAFSLLTAFLHRVFLILFIAGTFAFARKYFTATTEGYFSLMYSMLFINVSAVVIIWFYNRYRNIKNISEKSINTIKELSIFVLPPKMFGVLYAAVSIIDTIFCVFVPLSALKTGNYALYTGAMFVVGMYAILMMLNMAMLQGLLRSEIDLTTKTDEVETLKNYTETIENLLDEMQKSRHDYKNMILSIQDFVIEKRFDELGKYFEDEILKSENLERASKNIYMATKQIKNLPLKSLVNAKLNEAISKGIKVEITIFAEIDIKFVMILDLCRIVGNLLDNAYDAAIESEEKIISLIMLKNENQFSITLCNSFDGDVDMSKVWRKGYSSKGKNRGQGLSIVKKLIEQHPNILLNTEIKNNLFVQDITIEE